MSVCVCNSCIWTWSHLPQRHQQRWSRRRAAATASPRMRAHWRAKTSTEDPWALTKSRRASFWVSTSGLLLSTHIAATTAVTFCREPDGSNAHGDTEGVQDHAHPHAGLGPTAAAHCRLQFPDHQIRAEWVQCICCGTTCCAYTSIASSSTFPRSCRHAARGYTAASGVLRGVHSQRAGSTAQCACALVSSLLLLPFPCISNPLLFPSTATSASAAAHPPWLHTLWSGTVWTTIPPTS